MSKELQSNALFLDVYACKKNTLGFAIDGFVSYKSIFVSFLLNFSTIIPYFFIVSFIIKGLFSQNFTSQFLEYAFQFTTTRIIAHVTGKLNV